MSVQILHLRAPGTLTLRCDVTTQTDSPFYRPATGLYDPRFEHDACGVSFVANMKGVASHDIV
ncbi:MAG: hypothetical protein ACKOA5_12535, partial [Actinomycetota bacterium]